MLQFGKYKYKYNIIVQKMRTRIWVKRELSFERSKSDFVAIWQLYKCEVAANLALSALQ